MSQISKQLVLENSKVKLEFDEDGLPTRWTNKKIEQTFQFHQSYNYYFGVGGQRGQQSSGAYIFR
jgi:hypothetical protein